MKVFVIGVGMGNADTLTLGAKRAVEESELIVGARRLLEPFGGLACEKVCAILPDDIAGALDARPGCKQASVLMSGDVGFYSGATKLYERLGAHDVEALPGVSSLQYFCARLKTPWQDVNAVSAHGRACDPAAEVRAHARTFLLTGGKTKASDVCAQLVCEGLGGLVVHVGERLSYDDERIVSGRADELAGKEFLNLAVMLVENPDPGAWRRVPGELE